MIRVLCLALLSLLTVGSASAQQEIVLQQVATGLVQPVAIAHAGDTRLFITEQRGTVVIFDGTRILPAPFLDLRNLVGSSGFEQGLLSVAFHPRYAENGFFYVNYTDVGGDTVVARYSVSASDPNRADITTARVLLRIDQPFANHNGGQMQFGPDGYLYIGMGDGGFGGDPGNRAQNLGDLLGKMLRIDVDSGNPYGIPPSNPFINTPGARDEIWSFGLRNPWRFTFDRASGDLWIADVGQGLLEEVNFQPATSTGRENWGWRLMEGTRCFNPTSNCNDGTLVLPVIEYGHDNGACSVTGGYVYRGTRFARLAGTYIYGDFCNGVIWGATRNGMGGFTSRVLLDTSFSLSTFGEDIAGELYVADHAGGRLFHIESNIPRPPRRRAVRK
jgi:glucose/arabinose dehydrogenase